LQFRAGVADKPEMMRIGRSAGPGPPTLPVGGRPNGAARHDGSVALVLFDIDHVMQINDTNGHPFGDQTLVAVSGALHAVVRAHETVARIGGEEFALLLPGATLDEAHEIAERARGQLGTIALPHGALSCSVGVALAQGAEARDSDLFAEADRALYSAKRQGRGRTILAVG
jgi:two-component system cell cycle response regulator